MSDSKIQPLVTVDNPYKEEEEEEFYDEESGVAGENTRSEDIQNVTWVTKESQKSQKEKRKNSNSDEKENENKEEQNQSEDKNEDEEDKQSKNNEENVSNQRVKEACQKLAEDCKELMEAIKEHDRIKAATGVASEKCESIKTGLEQKLHSIQERIAKYVPSPIARTCGYCTGLLHFSVLSAISITERLADYGCNKYKGTYASAMIDSLANSAYRNTLGYFRTNNENSEQKICETS